MDGPIFSLNHKEESMNYGTHFAPWALVALLATFAVIKSRFLWSR